MASLFIKDYSGFSVDEVMGASRRRPSRRLLEYLDGR